MKSLIIDRPDKMSLRQKYADNVLKIFLMLGWLYLGIPALTLGAWYIAYTFFNQHLILLEGYKEYQTSTSIWYLAIIAFLLVLVLAWSHGSKFFFKDKKRAETDTRLSIEESGHYYQIAPEDIRRYRKMKTMTVSITEEGHIDGVWE